MEISKEEKILMRAISRFFKETAEKHKVNIEELNLHIDGNTLQIQKYVYGGCPEFQPLEIIDLNGL